MNPLLLVLACFFIALAVCWLGWCLHLAHVRIEQLEDEILDIHEDYLQ